MIVICYSSLIVYILLVWLIIDFFACVCLDALKFILSFIFIRLLDFYYNTNGLNLLLTINK